MSFIGPEVEGGRARGPPWFRRNKEQMQGKVLDKEQMLKQEQQPRKVPYLEPFTASTVRPGTYRVSQPRYAQSPIQGVSHIELSQSALR